MSLSDKSLEELQAKLAGHRKQLDDVNKLMRNAPSDTLRSLKKDLKQVIELTSTLIETKKKKGEDAKKHSKEERRKQQPREWGDEKLTWAIGERCQAKFIDNKWYIGQIIDIGTDPGTQTIMHKVQFVDANRATAEDLAQTLVQRHALRTYVPPLREEIEADMEVRARWDEDGLWYGAKIDAITEEGLFNVTFTEYGNTATVPLADLQHQFGWRRKKRLAEEAKKEDIAQTSFDLNQIPNQAIIPAKLQITADDSESVRKLKKKKQKKIKYEHKKMKREAEQNARRNNWADFQNKGSRKAKKLAKKGKFKASVAAQSRESIFKSTVHGKVGVTGSGQGMTSFHSQAGKSMYHNLRHDPNAF